MDDPAWYDVVKAAYREAQAELMRRRGDPPSDLDYVKDDLREALLDMKQAVIDNRKVDALRYLDEVKTLESELRGGDPHE